MPLPALLLERLKRRKIIQDDLAEKDTFDDKRERKPESSESAKHQKDGQVVDNAQDNQDEEEIIAEDYSEEEEFAEAEIEIEKEQVSDSNLIQSPEELSCNKPFVSPQKEKDEVECKTVLSLGQSVIGCPNKYNIYHECSQYCIDKYSDLEDISPTLEQRKQLAILLKTYPLSNEWTVVYDPGVKTFYFWNIISNMVSWLPPSMNALITLPADQIRQSLKS